MHLISKTIRYIFRQFEAFLYKVRIVKLKLLYPGITIDFKTKIEKGCSIICVDGGKLTIINSHISFGTLIKADFKSTLTIRNSFLGRNCVIAAKKQIVINNNCLIAEHVVIRDQDHSTDPLLRNSFSSSPIEIHQNSWIASKATILKGVTIGRNSVIAASAVVKTNVPSSELWAGIPAKKIKSIGTSLPVLYEEDRLIK
jgi:acetyltransferase-like isoleucine patch superfamily enzyme